MPRELSKRSFKIDLKKYDKLKKKIKEIGNKYPIYDYFMPTIIDRAIDREIKRIEECIKNGEEYEL